MGQQQLLLLVLGIVIVGIAVVIGLQAFSENSKKTNMDALVDDAIDIATSAQTWMLKSRVYGGGNHSCATTCDWSGATLELLGFATTSSGAYSNINGQATIDGSTSPTQFVIVSTNVSYGNQVTITVVGTDPGDISSSIDPEFSP